MNLILDNNPLKTVEAGAFANTVISRALSLPGKCLGFNLFKICKQDRHLFLMTYSRVRHELRTE